MFAVVVTPSHGAIFIRTLFRNDIYICPHSISKSLKFISLVPHLPTVIFGVATFISKNMEESVKLQETLSHNNESRTSSPGLSPRYLF